MTLGGRIRRDRRAAEYYLALLATKEDTEAESEDHPTLRLGPPSVRYCERCGRISPTNVIVQCPNCGLRGYSVRRCGRCDNVFSGYLEACPNCKNPVVG